MCIPKGSVVVYDNLVTVIGLILADISDVTKNNSPITVLVERRKSETDICQNDWIRVWTNDDIPLPGSFDEGFVRLEIIKAAHAPVFSDGPSRCSRRLQ